jgi:hypothetical protein
MLRGGSSIGRFFDQSTGDRDRARAYIWIWGYLLWELIRFLALDGGPYRKDTTDTTS